MYVHGNRIETISVIHCVDAEKFVRRRIYTLNDAPRKIVRDYRYGSTVTSMERHGYTKSTLDRTRLSDLAQPRFG